MASAQCVDYPLDWNDRHGANFNCAWYGAASGAPNANGQQNRCTLHGNAFSNCNEGMVHDADAPLSTHIDINQERLDLATGWQNGVCSTANMACCACGGGGGSTTSGDELEAPSATPSTSPVTEPSACSLPLTPPSHLRLSRRECPRLLRQDHLQKFRRNFPAPLPAPVRPCVSAVGH
jgi:hypothetical protein